MCAAYSAAMALLEPDATVAQPTWLDRQTDFSGAGGSEIVFRNVGTKPLRLCVALLADGSNKLDGSIEWHEVSLYRAVSGQFAVALRFVRATSLESTIHRARVFETMDDAATWLETFDPIADLSADFDVSDIRLSAARVALKASALRERAERLDRAYRVLVGEVLYRLATDS